MKIKLFLVLSLLLFLWIHVSPPNAFCFYRLNAFLFSKFLIEHLPGASFYPSFFENYVPDATFLIEESNGFSLLDAPKVYYEGDSFVHFNWFYNGFPINSALDDGSPAVSLPFFSMAQYELRGEAPFYRDYGLNFIFRAPDETFSRIRLSNVWSNLGGFVPWATTFVDPHATTPKRDDLLYTERRKISKNYLVDFVFNKKIRQSNLFFSFSYFDLERQFNDFNLYDSVFKETGKLILLHSQYRKTFKEGFFQVMGVFNILSRDNDLAELGRLPQETRKKEKQSLFSGLELKKKSFNLKLSFIHEKEDLDPVHTHFLKDLKDNDGDSFFPLERLGSFSSYIFRLNFDLPFEFPKRDKKMRIELFGNLKWASLRGSESPFSFNPISFDRQPYLVVRWMEGRDYRNRNVHIRMGTIFTGNLGDKVSLFAKFLIQHSSLRFLSSENDVTSVDAGFDAGVVLFKNRNPEILLSYGQVPYEFRENVNFFLEKNRPHGTIYRWSDRNNDLQYQDGEEGEIFGYTGGPFHSLDAELRLPIRKRFLVSISTKLSEKFSVYIKGLYKKVSHNFWVRFREDYGFFDEIDGRELYFYSRPFREYELTNYSFDKEPFYGQILFQLKGSEERRWFFSFSFLAHIGMGYTAYGNGPAANDIGVLAESQANPNSWINGYGRVDGDRAYVGKMYFGFYLFKKLFIAASLKYRDGDPFAFINTAWAHGQRVLYFKTIQAEDERGVKGGPREDYLSDISIKVKYKTRVFDRDVEFFVSLFNAFDFGSELSEYVFSGGSRLANELQIPRSLRVGLSLKL